MRLALALGLWPALGLWLTPLAATAQQFTPPAGCTAYLTVQMASCTLSHHFTCEDDPQGHQRRVDMDEEGMTYFGQIDAETQWIESFHLRSDHSERLAPDPADPASLSGLIATGRDSYDFRTLSDSIGETRYVGEDRLTGTTVTIDGVTLDETAYSIRALGPDGTELWRSEGTEYISRAWRMFLSGRGTVSVPDDSFETDDTPVEFLFPGDAGFLSVNPKHGCGVMMSALTLPAMSVGMR